MSVASMVVTGSASVERVGLHVHGQPARSGADPMTSFRSEDHRDISGGSGTGGVRVGRREYEMMLLSRSCLRLCRSRSSLITRS